MKIRTGFVSNSSSTSFTFIIKKGNIEEVYSKIKKYSHYFDLLYDMSWENSRSAIVSCNANSVIEAMKRCISDSNKEEWNPAPSIQPIRNILHSIRDDKKNCLITQLQKISSSTAKWEKDRYRILCKKESKLKNLIKKGFSHYLIVEFGDNDGDVEGGNVGCVMDYEGRYIKIDNSDFIVFTEQNR